MKIEMNELEYRRYLLYSYVMTKTNYPFGKLAQLLKLLQRYPVEFDLQQVIDLFDITERHAYRIISYLQDHNVIYTWKASKTHYVINMNYITKTLNGNQNGH